MPKKPPAQHAGKAAHQRGADPSLPWWQAATVYQIYPRSFADSNGDGIGDLRGITGRLGYLADLGIDAIWLSPVYRSPMADFGYDISDHTDIDPVFGTRQDADELIAAAHAHGIRIIFDAVLGHTSDQHPWFAAAASSRDDPYRDFYTWRDGPTPGAPDGGPPNNWAAGFPPGAPAWTWHAPTRQWYLHSHLPQEPDLNWDNPAVVQAQLKVLRYWLDRGVDGVRLDSINRIGKDPRLGDNLPGQPERQQNWPTVHHHLRTVRKLLDGYPDRVAVGEVWLFDQQQLMPYLAADELHLVHNFVFARLPFTAGAFAATISEFTRLAAPHAWPAWFLSNHDEPRPASRFGTVPDAAGDSTPDGRGTDRARLAAVLLLTLRGTPFLYQGEELALPDTPVPASQATDRNGRDPQRTPLPWQPPSRAGPGAGFTAGTPWLPIGPAAELLNVETQRVNPDSTFNLYRRLIQLRRTRRSLICGAQDLSPLPGEVLGYARHTANETTVVVLNFSTSRVSADLSQVPQASRHDLTMAVSTHPRREAGVIPAGGTVQLDGLEGAVLTAAGT